MNSNSVATIRYRLDLSYALHSISPALSALHTSRAATLHPEIATFLNPSHCAKCGSCRFPGGHLTPLTSPFTKKKRRRAMLAPQRKCHVCGFSVDVDVGGSTDCPSAQVQLPSNFSETRAMPAKGRESPPNPHPAIETAPTLSRESQPKSSRAKTSAVKSMLSRDRQREGMSANKKKQTESHVHEGLAAFLKEL